MSKGLPVGMPKFGRAQKLNPFAYRVKKIDTIYYVGNLNSCTNFYCHRLDKDALTHV
jgi:hypothetical protein